MCMFFIQFSHSLYLIVKASVQVVDIILFFLVFFRNNRIAYQWLAFILLAWKVLFHDTTIYGLKKMLCARFNILFYFWNVMIRACVATKHTYNNRENKINCSWDTIYSINGFNEDWIMKMVFFYLVYNAENWNS